ncbi:MAG: response regulator SirA [Chloroflexi bacterium HGW-Chloroflexi-4]|jgi:uridine kinase|nr:MAG: response regulator SirA [Chloroflexi bacterium HGW-Chloroflexi-4]
MGWIKSVIKRSGAVVPFTPDRITNAIYRAAVEVGGRDRELAKALSQQVVDILERNPDPDYMPFIEEIQDVVEKVLIENGHAKVAKAYILYRNERTNHRKQQETLSSHSNQPSPNIPWAKIWHILDWAVDHGVNTVEGLNHRIKAGEYSQIVTESEAAYMVDVEHAVNGILARKSELKMVLITGPSSSGKTTTTIKINQKLKEHGLKLVTLNVDNYFLNLDMHPKDEFGDYDFETPFALDLQLINSQLAELVAGNQINVPFYDFKLGKRGPNVTPLSLKPDELLLIDSLHGLFPGLTSEISNEQKYKLYLEPLLQMKGIDGEFIHWTDIRLMRRMLRDAAQRAYDPRQTLEHWHYVRDGEMRHIIPNIIQADEIINSAMPFELPIYTHRLLNNFLDWQTYYKNDPLHEDAFMRADRVAELLKTIHPVEDDSYIPSDSVVREFIGGSSLDY